MYSLAVAYVVTYVDSVAYLLTTHPLTRDLHSSICTRMLSYRRRSPCRWRPRLPLSWRLIKSPFWLEVLLASPKGLCLRDSAELDAAADAAEG